MRPLERLIERPPVLFRALFPGAVFRLDSPGCVFLTFDDGPIPEATPLVLDILKSYDAKATFFMVGQNVERYPELLTEVRAGGHSVGNHTHRHLQGRCVSTEQYLEDVAEADSLIGSRLFRPPHGLLRPSQLRALRRSHRVVMYDLVSRDYSRLTDSRRIVDNVTRLARDGSIIVFHDSLKSLPKFPEALQRSLDLLLSRGFRLLPLPEDGNFNSLPSASALSGGKI